ncbi:hypothetical protein Ocin01_12227 [Orchesella cincta]|uniref:Uncharacterized protein n=1 Tax=Orchesella cincta TaxID=48709 RepID=A0A1D2MNM0_ORCCI|nr:hypothetical protein Ocin01_12227 [Orchesella cincta]
MAHDEKYTMLIVPFALLLVLGSLPQNALGLKCYTCETEKCSDTEIKECDSTETVCMGMEFILGPPLSDFAPKDTPLPKGRGCFSAAMASCVGNTDNKCYPLPDVRDSCKGIIEVVIKPALDGIPNLPPGLASQVISTLDGKVCACTTDLCNNEIKEQPAVVTPTPSSGTVVYENLKFHQWIVTFLLAILYSQA